MRIPRTAYLILGTLTLAGGLAAWRLRGRHRSMPTNGRRTGYARGRADYTGARTEPAASGVF